MLQLLIGTDIPFMKFRRFAYLFSGALMLITLGWFFTRGPRYSVDFTGGTMIMLRTASTVHADVIRGALEKANIAAELQQIAGPAGFSDFLIRFRTEADPVQIVLDAVHQNLPGVPVELRSKGTVCPKGGGQLRRKSAWP